MQSIMCKDSSHRYKVNHIYIYTCICKFWYLGGARLNFRVECNQPCHLFWLDSLSVINKAALDLVGTEDLGISAIQRTTWIHVSDGFMIEPTRMASCESPGIGRSNPLFMFAWISEYQRTIKTAFRFDGCFHLTLDIWMKAKLPSDWLIVICSDRILCL
jgi:hypothetical protein